MSGDTLPFPGGDFPRPFGVPRVAGPESVAEHLRNALQLLASLQERLAGWPEGIDDTKAVQRRVAAALAQLEERGSV